MDKRRVQRVVRQIAQANRETDLYPHGAFFDCQEMATINSSACVEGVKCPINGVENLGECQELCWQQQACRGVTYHLRGQCWLSQKVARHTWVFGQVKTFGLRKGWAVEMDDNGDISGYVRDRGEANEKRRGLDNPPYDDKRTACAQKLDDFYHCKQDVRFLAPCVSDDACPMRRGIFELEDCFKACELNPDCEAINYESDWGTKPPPEDLLDNADWLAEEGFGSCWLLGEAFETGYFPGVLSCKPRRCHQNYRVDSNRCVPCPDDEVSMGGASPAGPDTQCILSRGPCEERSQDKYACARHPLCIWDNDRCFAHECGTRLQRECEDNDGSSCKWAWDRCVSRCHPTNPPAIYQRAGRAFCCIGDLADLKRCPEAHGGCSFDFQCKGDLKCSSELNAILDREQFGWSESEDPFGICVDEGAMPVLRDACGDHYAIEECSAESERCSWHAENWCCHLSTVNGCLPNCHDNFTADSCTEQGDRCAWCEDCQCCFDPSRSPAGQRRVLESCFR